MYLSSVLPALKCRLMLIGGASLLMEGRALPGLSFFLSGSSEDKHVVPVGSLVWTLVPRWLGEPLLSSGASGGGAQTL